MEAPHQRYITFIKCIINDSLHKVQVCVPNKPTIHGVFNKHSYLSFILTKSQRVPHDCSKDIRDKELHLDKCPLWLTPPKPFLKIGPNRLYKSLSITTWHLHHRGWQLFHIQMHIFLNSIVFNDSQAISS